MISATVHFETNVDAFALVDSLRGLPPPIEPVYFAEDEGKIIKSNLLSDETRFVGFQEKNQIGFFLYTEDKTLIDVSTPNFEDAVVPIYASVTIYMENHSHSQFVTDFFKCLIRHKPVFGFAAKRDEYDHRNRHYITIGKNHIEAWIGRNLDKYIPGVYWYTLLSDVLLSKHGASLADLSAEAISCENKGDGSLHLLKFYERPEDWRDNAERLDDLCEKVQGVFSKRSVETAVRGVDDYWEYDEIIGNWR